jgi:hypothetical protein
MLVIRHLLAFVILLNLCTGLRGETYHEWEDSVPNPTTFSFKKWLPPQLTQYNINNGNFSLFDSPTGHLFGHLDFFSFPAQDFPLRVRFLYYRIGASSVNDTPNENISPPQDWTSPIGYLAENASIGELLESREVQVKSAVEGTAVPVWSIRFQTGRFNSESPVDPYSVLIEVESHDGTILARRRLIEAVSGATEPKACLAKANSGAETYLEPLTNLATADSLPLDERLYEYVKVLWLDDFTLQDATKYTDSFWRKAFLSGTTVLGHASEVQALAQRLGISPNQRILQGGLWSVENPTIDFSATLKSNSDDGAQGQYSLDLKKGQNPFQNPFDFGKRRTRELLRFSIGFLVTFILFEAAIIIGSLFFLPGHRRVLRWLLIPLSAIVYTAIGLVVVHFVVDFRPETLVLQYVDSVEGWPESLVRTDVTRLSFADERASFSTKALADFDRLGGDLNSCPELSSQSDDKTVFSIAQRYGRFSGARIRYWLPASSPCHILANREIVATRPLQGAWIWNGETWRNLGPMDPGKPVAIDNGPVVIDPSQISTNGEPADLDNPYLYRDMLPEEVRHMCDTQYMNTLRNTNVGILIAIDAQAVPDQMGDSATSEVHTQTILIHQFQLPPAKP